MSILSHHALPERITSKIYIAPSGCWLWTGPRNDRGYGRVHWDGQSRPTHRVVRHLVIGDVPVTRERDEAGDFIDLDHRCRDRACVNPAHLEAVTHAVNVARSGILALGICRSGKHAITGPQDVRQRPNGHAECRECSRATNAACERRAAARRAGTGAVAA